MIETITIDTEQWAVVPRVPTHKMVMAGYYQQMINARLEAVTNQYRYAVGSDRKIEAEAMAETKWQLAELKMQFVDLLLELAQESDA